MRKLYFYKVRVDNEGAPCVQDGLLSLAICKPGIRSTAKEGDIVFGFAADSLHEDNRFLYVARITKKVGWAGRVLVWNTVQVSPRLYL
jgi:hypothetical protein